MRRIVVIIFVLAAVASCVSIDCPVQNQVEYIFALKKPTGGTDTMGIDTLSIWAHRVGRKDTLLINRLCGVKATSFSVSASHMLEEDSLFTLLTDTTKQRWLDTICIQKTNHPHFESVDCKATYFHTITAVTTTSHGIDSISINNKEVNYDQTETFFLYLKANR